MPLQRDSIAGRYADAEISAALQRRCSGLLGNQMAARTAGYHPQPVWEVLLSARRGAIACNTTRDVGAW